MASQNGAPGSAASFGSRVVQMNQLAALLSHSPRRVRIDHPQDAAEEVARHSHFGHLEDRVARVSDDLRASLDHLLAQGGQRPAFDLGAPRWRSDGKPGPGRHAPFAASTSLTASVPSAVINLKR